MKHVVAKLQLALLVVLLLASTATVSAAADAWLPGRYSPGTNVYVDPALTNHPQYPVVVGGLQENLERLSRDQNITIVFVMQQLVPNPVPPQYNNVYSAWQADELWSRWGGQSAFPKSNSCVIFLTRGAKNPNSYSYAGSCGANLHAFGLGPDYFSGNLLEQARNTYLTSGDVTAYASNVASSITSTIAKVKSDAAAREQAERDRVQKEQEAAARRAAEAESSRQFRARLPYYIGGGVLALIFFGLIGYVLVTYSSRKSKLKKIVDEWAPKIDNINICYTKIQTAYLDFITNQKGRRQNLVGKSLTQYQEAIKLYNDFCVRRERLSERFIAAQTALTQASMFNLGALAKAIASVTTDQVQISEEEIALKNIKDATGGTVTKTFLPANELLEKTNSSFVECNGKLAALKGAFEGALQNERDIAALLAKKPTLTASLSDNGLTIDPYDDEWTTLAGEAETTIATIASNPVEALSDSTRIEAAIEAVQTRINSAVTLKQSLTPVGEALDKAVTGVAESRKQPVAFNYALVPGEARPETAAAEQTIALIEEGSDPDTHLTAASAHLTKALASVLAGDLKDAESEKSLCETQTKAATELVKTVLAAKDVVERNVSPIRGKLSTLKAAIPAAESDVTELQTWFLAANYAGQPEKVGVAQAAVDATEGRLAVVRTAYFEQRFVAALAELNSVNADLVSSRNGLIELNTRLNELTAFRNHARTTVAAAETYSSQLKAKRTGGDYRVTTAASTDSQHEAAIASLGAQKADVAKEITDWPAAAQAADRVTTTLKTISQAVDEQYRAHAAANAKVGEVETAVRTAQSECNHQDVTDATESKLRTAQTELRTLRDKLSVPKSDWAAITREATPKLTAAQAVTTAAKADKEAATAARTAITAADAQISQIESKSYSKTASIGPETKTFGYGVSANLEAAARWVAQARTNLRQQNYASAQQDAQRAVQEVQTADRAAKANVDGLITTARTAYEAEQERLRLLAEAAAEKERLRLAAEAKLERDRLAAQATANQPRVEHQAPTQRHEDRGPARGGSDSNQSRGPARGGQDSDFQ